jgi:alpha-tubulin suppressor-like RCC1 family protein
MRFWVGAPCGRWRRVAARRAIGLGAAVILGAASLGVATAVPAAAQESAGPVLASGHNPFGELGNGTTDDSGLPVPASLPPGTAATSVAAGSNFSLAATTVGGVLAWGLDTYGQLGDGTTTDSLVPVPTSLPPGTFVTQVAAGWQHGLALTSTGTLYAWGRNNHGQLGTGSTTDSTVPVPVVLPPSTTITAISAGGYHNLALTSTGQVLAWGYNGQGELGNGSKADSPLPVTVHLPAGTIVTSIGAGGQHSAVVASNGRALTWGHNDRGQLGDASRIDRILPVPVELPSGVAAAEIRAGYAFTVARTTGGQVLAWGRNVNGELGNGDIHDNAIPVQTVLPPGVTAITIDSASSAFHSFARLNNGSVLGWGRNVFGSLGNGLSATSVTIPVAAILAANTTVTAVAAGFEHSLFIAQPPFS